VYVAPMTEEQRKAHLRMLASLPSRKNQYVEESDITTASQVIVNGRRYPSITKAAKGERMSVNTLYDLESKGLVRFIRQDLSAGIPIFNASTSTKGLKARIRRREREADK